MAVVENKGMAEGFRFGVVGLIVFDETKEIFINKIRMQEILPNFLTGASISRNFVTEEFIHGFLHGFYFL